MSSSAYMIQSIDTRLADSLDITNVNSVDSTEYSEAAAASGNVEVTKITPTPEKAGESRAEMIERALAQQNTAKVAELATSPGGLVNGHYRALAWPVLLATNRSKFSSDTDLTSSTSSSGSLSGRTGLAGLAGLNDFLSFNDLPPHKDEAQVMLDIKRSFTVVSQFSSFNEHSSFTTILSQDDIDSMRKRLYSLVVRMLRTYPCLNYYQGYHDVASIVLLMCNECSDTNDDNAFAILEALTLNHLRDFMISDIALSINHLKLIPLILEEADPDLFQLIVETSNSYNATGGAYYDYKFLPALSSILTLFSHDICNLHQLSAIWDFILGHGSVATSAYLYAATIIHRKSFILGKESAHLDSDSIHTKLSPTNLFSELTDEVVGKVLATASELIHKHDLTRLPNVESTYNVWFGEFNCNSVIVTSSCLESPFSEQVKGAESLAETVELQEDQQRRESKHDAEQFTKAIANMDSEAGSLESSISSTNAPSLFSSLASLTAASSGVNNTLANSSIALKKLLQIHDNDNDEPRKRARRLSHRSFYRMSLTIGFVGVLLHCLMQQTEFATFMKFSARDTVESMRYFLSGPDSVRTIAQSVVSNVKEPVKGLEVMGEVGLGSLKKTIYALGSLV